MNDFQVPKAKRTAYVVGVVGILCTVLVGLALIFNPYTLPFLHRSLPDFSLNSAEYFSAGFAIMGGLIMLLVAFSFFPDFDRTRLALMLEMAGAGTGWLLGMFFSPTGPTEQQTFMNAKTALVGIVSGYLLSKLQTALDRAIKEGKVFNSNWLVLALIFLIPLMLTTAVVYTEREYKDQANQITRKQSSGESRLNAGTPSGADSVGPVGSPTSEQAPQQPEKTLTTR
jgi:hypothetical protein